MMTVFRPVPLDVQQHFLEGSAPEDGVPASGVLAEFEERVEPYLE